MNVETMRDSDLADALELSASQGWNQTLADWSRLLRLAPRGCYTLRIHGQLVGTVTTTSYGRELAWVGMMVVHPDFRRRGMGRVLMQRALDGLMAAGVTCVKLDATPAGRPLYESLGFQPEAEIERWRGTGGPGRAAVRAATDADWRSLCALDRAAIGADRADLLEALAADGLVGPLVIGAEGDPEGCALVRRGRSAAYLGPLIARTARAAEELFAGAFELLADEEVVVDHHVDGLLRRELLADLGLAPERALTRMRIGKRITPEAPGTLCTSAGPEVG